MSTSQQSPGTLTILGVLATAELLVRGVTILFASLEPLVEATSLLLRFVLNAQVLGLGIGWLQLGAAVFHVVTEMYADEYLDWGNDVLNRMLVAVGTPSAVLPGARSVDIVAPFR